ncbi:MAG: phage/plasmid primase, P4 family, partial [Thermoprotei archaeon]
MSGPQDFFPFIDYSAGINVFPLAAYTKTPGIPELKSVLEQRVSEEQVWEWFPGGEAPGYGVVCGAVSGGLVVLDIEREADARALFQDWPTLASSTRVVKTPHGGVHVYLYADDVPRRTTKVFGAEHPVDVLGEGGYACGPGTVVDHARCPRKQDGSLKEGCPGSGLGKYELVGTQEVKKVKGNPLEIVLSLGRSLGWLPRSDGAVPVASSLDEKLAKLRGNKKFVELYEGRWQQLGYPSRSEAEEALAVLCVEAGLSDAETSAVLEAAQIGKWKEKEESYRRLTLQKAHDFVFSRQSNRQVKEVGEESVDVYGLAKRIGSEGSYRRIIYWSRGGSKRDWVYNPRDGAWRLGAENIIEKELTDILVDSAASVADVEDVVKPSASLLDMVIRVIMTKNMVEETDDRAKEPPSRYINVANGVIDLETGDLLPHSPDYFFTSSINVEYKPTAQCPRFMNFLSQILDAQWIDTIQEMLGYILLRENSARRAFMFIGSGGNGKSLLLNIISEWLGQSNVSNIPLQSLEWDRFAPAQLVGKHLNVFADLPQTPLSKSEIFRSLTGGDALTAEQKFKDGFSFKPYAKLVFSTNRPPPVKDQEVDAFFDRWLLIYFERTFKDDPVARQKIFDECTTPEEKSGILNWALDGLKRLLASGHFSNEKESKERREEWMREANPAYDFLFDTIVKDPRGTISKQELWQRYIGYCEAQGIPTPTRQNEFSSLIVSRFGATSIYPRVNGRREYRWAGITWKK